MLTPIRKHRGPWGGGGGGIFYVPMLTPTSALAVRLISPLERPELFV